MNISPETNVTSISDIQLHLFTESGDINFVYVFGLILCVFLVVVFVYEIRCVEKRDFEKIDDERGEFLNTKRKEKP
jgi:hypothetical protein